MLSKKDLPEINQETEKKSFLRYPAVKNNIKQILDGRYIEELGNDGQNYLFLEPIKEGEIKNDKSETNKIYRHNIIAVIIKKERNGSITNFFIEDGTGRIILRIFEDSDLIDNLNAGDVILTVCRTRTYNQEKYLSPEIIKKTTPLWLKIRSLELNFLNLKDKIEEKPEDKKNVKIFDTKNNLREEANQREDAAAKNKIKDDESEEDEIIKNETEKEMQKIDDQEDDEIEEDCLLPIEKLKNLISKLDQGNGVLIEEVIENSEIDQTEKLIEKMLENGDIFQNLPGKIKIL